MNPEELLSTKENERRSVKYKEAMRLDAKKALKEMSMSVMGLFDDFMRGAPLHVIFKKERLRGLGLSIICISIALLIVYYLYKLDSAD